jgi:DNA topoisomerase-6 subunit B
MGISAAGMYGQLTVGKPVHIISRIAGDARASELYVSLDTAKNRPDIHRKKRLEWDRPHGTRVEMEMEGHPQKGPHSIEAYVKQTAIANPHLTISYQDPGGQEILFARSIDELPPRPKEIKPHPYGVELGRLIQMLSTTASRTLSRFLVDEFSGVGKKTALDVIARAGKPLSERSYPRHIAHVQAVALHRALLKTRVAAPRTDCIVPIGEPQLLAGLRKEVPAAFYTATTRPAAVYRGNPFQVEVAIAYGPPEDVGGTDGEGLVASKDEPVRLLRFGNRVPLLYQQSSCAITKAVIQTNWRAYGLHQPKGALPIAPMAILVHVASVWVPYTSESKEAIEPYPDILREIRLGLQQCGRRLAAHVRRDMHLRQEAGRRAYIETYLPQIGIALQEILALTDDERDATVRSLDDVLRKSRTRNRRPEP